MIGVGSSIGRGVDFGGSVGLNPPTISDGQHVLALVFDKTDNGIVDRANRVTLD